MYDITIKPYKHVSIREMIEFSKSDFTSILSTLHAPFCYHCDGVAMIEDRYNPKDDEFENQDRALILRLHYCIMPFTPTIKSNNNIEIQLIPTTSSLYIEIVKMIKKTKKNWRANK